MIKLIKKVDINFIIFLISTFISYSWSNFYYDSTVNVDFSKYYDYINYFLNNYIYFNYKILFKKSFALVM